VVAETDVAGIAIVRPGMLTSVQDLGRWGLQARGVPVAGPMDEYSHRLANRLVGNDPSAAALEITLIGPEVQATHDVVCAVAGASFGLTAGGEKMPMNVAFGLRGGTSLRFGDRLRGARATLAVRGGIAVDPIFGSRATSLIARMGPFDGRPLRAGDVLPIGDEVSERSSEKPMTPLSLPAGGARVRVLPGPHAEMFTAAAYERLLGGTYMITPQSNRMGYRLDGPSLAHRGAADILSDATAIGSIQVPASGQPILLMADRQTTGGYPKIATVISADLPLAGQLAPGDWIEFRPCTPSEAHAAARERFGAFFGSVR
jgi:antagonist of KipI